MKKLQDDDRLRKDIDFNGSIEVGTYLRRMSNLTKTRVYKNRDENENGIVAVNLLNNKQIFFVMECLAIVEFCAWEKTSYGYKLIDDLDSILASDDNVRQGLSRVAGELWGIIDANPLLKDKLIIPQGFDGKRKPVDVANLPPKIQGKLRELASLQAQLEEPLRAVLPGDVEQYGVTLQESKQGSERGYGWQFYNVKHTPESGEAFIETVSDGSASNHYDLHKKAKQRFELNKEIIYRPSFKPTRTDFKDMKFNDKQKSVLGKILNYSNPRNAYVRVMSQIFQKHKIEGFFYREALNEEVEVLLKDVPLWQFLEYRFLAAWCISPEGVVVIGSPYYEKKALPMTPNCHLVIHER